MCWLCDHPDRTYDDFLDHVRELLDGREWLVQPVAMRPPYAPLAHTVGLSRYGCPELLVTGLSPARAAALLDEVAEHSLHARPPTPGQVVPLLGGPTYQAIEVSAPDVHLPTAVGLFGEGVRALQLVWADDRGRWPWRADFRGRRGGQPVLGPRTDDGATGGAADGGGGAVADRRAVRRDRPGPGRRSAPRRARRASRRPRSR